MIEQRLFAAAAIAKLSPKIANFEIRGKSGVDSSGQLLDERRLPSSYSDQTNHCGNWLVMQNFALIFVLSDNLVVNDTSPGRTPGHVLLTFSEII